MTLNIQKLVVCIKIMIAVTIIRLNLYCKDTVTLTGKYTIHLPRCKYWRDRLTETMEALRV